jgi:hypothetical protein
MVVLIFVCKVRAKGKAGKKVFRVQEIVKMDTILSAENGARTSFVMECHSFNFTTYLKF